MSHGFDSSPGRFACCVKVDSQPTGSSDWLRGRFGRLLLRIATRARSTQEGTDAHPGQAPSSIACAQQLACCSAFGVSAEAGRPQMYARFSEEDLQGNGMRPASQPGRMKTKNDAQRQQLDSLVRLPQPRKMGGGGGGYGEPPTSSGMGGGGGGGAGTGAGAGGFGPPSRGQSSMSSRGTTGAGTRPGSRSDLSMPSSMSMPRLDQRPATPEQIYKAAKADLTGHLTGRPAGAPGAWLTPPAEGAPFGSSGFVSGPGPSSAKRVAELPALQAPSADRIGGPPHGEGRLGDPDFVSPYDEHHKLKRELKRMRTFCESKIQQVEQEKQLALERQYIELTGTIEEKLKVAKEESKEERVELLRRQTVRRMISVQESYAWNAWTSYVDARNYAMHHLQKTRERIHQSSGLAPAFEFWAYACDEQRRADILADLKDKLRNLEARLAHAEEEKRVELERQLIQLTGPAEERLKLQEQEHQEAKIEIMRRQSTSTGERTRNLHIP